MRISFNRNIDYQPQ